MENLEANNGKDAIEPKPPEKSCRVWEEQGKWCCKFTHTEDTFWCRSEDSCRRFASLVGDNKDKITRFKVEMRMSVMRQKLTQTLEK